VRFPIPPRYTKTDVLLLRELIEAGTYRAVVDRRYPMADVVAATRYVETEHKTGNVILTITSADQVARATVDQEEPAARDRTR
jgi:hypothetical protein